MLLFGVFAFDSRVSLSAYTFLGCLAVVYFFTLVYFYDIAEKTATKAA